MFVPSTPFAFSNACTCPFHTWSGFVVGCAASLATSPPLLAAWPLVPPEQATPSNEINTIPPACINRRVFVFSSLVCGSTSCDVRYSLSHIFFFCFFFFFFC